MFFASDSQFVCCVRTRNGDQHKQLSCALKSKKLDGRFGVTLRSCLTRKKDYLVEIVVGSRGGRKGSSLRVCRMCVRIDWGPKMRGKDKRGGGRGTKVRRRLETTYVLYRSCERPWLNPVTATDVRLLSCSPDRLKLRRERSPAR